MILRGKTALVTGATNGIGRATIEKLASQGANIIFNGFVWKEAIDSIQTSLKEKYKVETFYHNSDMKKREEVEDLVEQGYNKFGNIDILVNNVGIAKTGLLWEMSIDDFEEVMKVNLFANFYLTRKVVPRMIKNNWGRIINISSITAERPSSHLSPYIASKCGIVGLTKALAKEVADKNITVNAVCPGLVKTNGSGEGAKTFAKQLGVTLEAFENMWLSSIPKKTMIQPEEIANVISFLSMEESRNITGSIYTVDAGYTI